MVAKFFLVSSMNRSMANGLDEPAHFFVKVQSTFPGQG